MIEAQRKISHVTDRDVIIAIRGRQDLGAFLDFADAEDCDLWLIDDRRAEQAAKDTRIGDGESAAGDFVGASALLGRPYAFVGERSAAEQGSLAGRQRDIVTFRLPVALPPPGTYGVVVEPAWRPGAEPGLSAPATAVVAKDGDWVELRADRNLPPGERLRITLGS